MSAEVFFDTNILVYATTIDDPRAGLALAWLRRGGVISAQVLNEFTNVSHRKLARPWSRIRADLASFDTIVPGARPVGFSTHRLALTIAERDGVAFYDALIIAAALEAECSTLLSEDMQHGRVIEGNLTILNPFR
ncbi:PIN domain-containing protein [Acidisoma cladoniae]|uniref:PIN domain-containing protein n=1 Tax=Acidisoma cladoniae TaxID=3040935 RepID=UPI00254E0C7B|nr:PIN domain-containing protein [Acidisoma sp. PAMC 29798]